MKKIIIIIVAVLAIAGCNSNQSTITGKYNLQFYAVGDQENFNFKERPLIFKADGSFILTGIDSTISTGNYHVEGELLTLQPDQGQELTFRIISTNPDQLSISPIYAGAPSADVLGYKKIE